MLGAEPVLWCSYDCGGAPAEYAVTFTFYGEEVTVNLCEECKPKFIERGPK